MLSTLRLTVFLILVISKTALKDIDDPPQKECLGEYGVGAVGIVPLPNVILDTLHSFDRARRLLVPSGSTDQM